MAEVFDCAESAQLLSGMRAARRAIGSGELVVLPTDTVYGVGADAFTPEAVTRLLEAKGRGRQSPPPVLIPNVQTVAALAAERTSVIDALADAFWPGPLTMVTTANPSLHWDLGDTDGTVALRIPAHPLALELLEDTGPLAVSSANRTGEPAARTAAEAYSALGDAVAVYLEGGEAPGGGVASTIVDVSLLGGGSPTDAPVRVLREGGVPVERLREVLSEVLTDVRIEV